MIPGRLARVSGTLASDIANPGGIAPNRNAPGCEARGVHGAVEEPRMTHDSTDVAFSVNTVKSADKWRYFCGVIRKILARRAELAVEIVGGQ